MDRPYPPAALFGRLLTIVKAGRMIEMNGRPLSGSFGAALNGQMWVLTPIEPLASAPGAVPRSVTLPTNQAVPTLNLNRKVSYLSSGECCCSSLEDMQIARLSQEEGQVR
jgi:hypothetical protein